MATYQPAIYMPYAATTGTTTMVNVQVAPPVPFRPLGAPAEDLDFEERTQITEAEFTYHSPEGQTFKLVREESGEMCVGLGMMVHDEVDAWCEVPNDEMPDLLAALITWLQAP